MEYLTDNFIGILVEWITSHGLPVLVIVILAFVVKWLMGLGIRPVIKRLVPKDISTPQSEKMREETLIRILMGVVRLVIWIVAILMILIELGVNIGPLLATAGIAGLAVGFGGQYLIRDIVAGFFVILENQYRVGDVVCLDQTCGLVEDITMRKATLRDLDGTVHHVEHGLVHRVSNLSKDFARVNLNISVSYSSDLEKVIEVVNAVGKSLAEDEKWRGDIVKAIQFERVDNFADSAIIVKVLGDTKPLRQWAVAGEYRKRLKIAFDKEGIEIPFPQRVVHAK